MLGCLEIKAFSSSVLQTLPKFCSSSAREDAWGSPGGKHGIDPHFNCSSVVAKSFSNSYYCLVMWVEMASILGDLQIQWRTQLAVMMEDEVCDKETGLAT